MREFFGGSAGRRAAGRRAAGRRAAGRAMAGHDPPLPAMAGEKKQKDAQGAIFPYGSI